MEICAWYDERYRSFVDELKTWATLKTVVTSKTRILLVLESDDNNLYNSTVRALSQTTYTVTVVANPTLNVSVMDEIYRAAEQFKVRFFFLDYKPFDIDIKSMYTGKFVKHIDVKTYYGDGPPISHETFHNMSTVLCVMGDKQFNYKGAKANIIQNREQCNLITMRCGAATCVLYTGYHDSGNIDVIHVYGDENNKTFIHEMGIPQDCRSYYERYGACIQMFLQNVNLLDVTFHKQRIKRVMSKFYSNDTGFRFR